MKIVNASNRTIPAKAILNDESDPVFVTTSLLLTHFLSAVRSNRFTRISVTFLSAKNYHNAILQQIFVWVVKILGNKSFIAAFYIILYYFIDNL